MEEQVQETQEIQETEEPVNVDIVDINTIHTDLSVIACFLVFFTLVIILKYIYKFFNMIFQF